MDKVRSFLQDKAFLWVVMACVVTAALVGVWAVRTMQGNLSQTPEGADSGVDPAGVEDYPGLAPGLDNNDLEDGQWDTGLDVAGKAEDVPESTAPAASRSSSGAASGQGSQSASGAAQSGSDASAAGAAPSYTQPVSGSVIQTYSGDELVYNKTLADWRTHNGVDYACGSGTAVYAPVAGQVTKIAEDASWGGVVELTDAEGLVWRLCGVKAGGLSQGDNVVIGQQLGTAETIGCESADGTHIHLELKQGDKYLDPAAKIG